VHTNCGVICSMILSALFSFYFIFKLTHVSTGQDLTISSYQKFGQFEKNETAIDLETNNF
jgi:hypothetical protein